MHWNVNGLKCKKSLNYNKKVDTITSYLEKNNSTLLLNIQETHIANEGELPNFVNLYKHIYHFEMTFVANNDPSAGIILCIRKTEEIIKSEVIQNGRLLHVQIRNTASDKVLNVFSVYLKSSNSIKQKETIQMIRERILSDQASYKNYIILGYFNFVTSSLDRNSRALNSVDAETSKIWIPFENECNIQDSFRITNPCRCLYSYTSNIDKRLSSRIDRIYVSTSIAGRILSSTFTPSKVSDHKVFKVKYAMKIDKGPGMWVFNNQLLKDSVYTRSVTTIFQAYSPQNTTLEGDERYKWDFLKQAIISFTKEYSKNKASRDNKKSKENTRDLAYLESLHPQKMTAYLLDRKDSLKEEISKQQEIKIKGALLRSKFPTFEEIEPNISFLRSLEKRKGEENTIYNIFDEDANIYRYETSEIKETIYNFYRTLYKKDPEDVSIQDTFLDTVHIRVFPSDKDSMDLPLDAEELLVSLTSLQANKTPGPDGLTREFYLHFWETIKHPYIRCVDEIRRNDELSEMQKRGAIKISFKKGDRSLIKNYRPITLLNIDLKIITKAVAKRLSNVLPKLINNNQTCVPGRHIENNIHIVQNLIDHINESEGQLALVFIDQEKAFDRMSHSFILKTLEKFGFGDSFIRWVTTICKGTKSFVKVNGYETYEFDIERGVRQGCPLSALLYVLTSEVLSTYIRKNKKIKSFLYGMENLQPLEHKIVQYADDNCIAVSNMSSLKELFVTLNKYERATNARVNKNKTEALWVGKWIGRVDLPLNLKWTSDHVKFLGIYVGNKVGASGSKNLSDLNSAEQIEKIKHKVSYWKGKGISLLGRIKVANIFLLSRLWYRTNIWTLSSQHIKTLEMMVRNYIWDDKKGSRVRQGVLQMGYEDGGLELVDINIKTKVQRIRRILYLLSLDKNRIERYLADTLIRNNSKYGQNSLSFGLISNIGRIKLIKNDFYKFALEVVNSINIVLLPGSVRAIKDEPIFYNTLLKDNENRVFPLSRFKNQMPKVIKDISEHTSSRIPEVEFLIRKVRISISKLSFTNQTENQYVITVNGNPCDLNKATFKIIYNKLLGSKLENKEWENKWEVLLQQENIIWKKHWQILHEKIHNSYVKSAQWEMLHLNFWSGFRAGERCCLCKEIESDSAHIINSCKVLIYLTTVFQMHMLYEDKQNLTFGLEDQSVGNYILFHIKSVVFRSRFKKYQNIDICKTSLTRKCKNNITKDLIEKFSLARHKGNLDSFSEFFIDGNNVLNLCTITNENTLQVHLG